MTKTMKIEGMKCPKCSARAQKALEALEGVESAVVSHTECSAVVTLSKEVSNDVLTKAVTDAGYQVVSVQ